MNQRHQPRIRRIVLPSGGAIEVRRFDRSELEERDLHVCPDCRSELVQPTSWSGSVDGHWALTLECPDCGWHESGVYGQGQVERLEDQIDEGLTELIDCLQRQTYANMAADVERFIGALRCDQIFPEDF
jgi:hypothetical protein